MPRLIASFVTLLVLLAGLQAPAADAEILEVTADTQLDPQKTYGAIIIRKSGVTLDGRGAWLIGAREGNPKSFRGTAITADGVSQVTIRNVNAKEWETGLHVRNGQGWTIEGCHFSDNFHDPEFGWGENGRRGGIVLEKMQRCTIRNNTAQRVWDACVLVDSHDNLIEDNNFSRTSNTCLKLWTASRNTVRGNNLSYGIRISPGEVHARDSTSVLIESGSNDNRMVKNDCTHGGDGIFVRVLNGWCSTGNWFEENDCSYANNNGVECWAPRNVFVRNRANHCSYGFWLGGSDQTRLIENEASFNGLATGHHNSPHLPDSSHAGIVFMFGPSSHTLARGNICRGNHGAGIALIGDLNSRGRTWKAYHWVLEQNVLEDNRWGIFAQHVDWVVLRGNQYRANTHGDTRLEGDVSRWMESREPLADPVASFRAQISGPEVQVLGSSSRWEGIISGGADPQKVQYLLDMDGAFRGTAQSAEYQFTKVGFHRIGLNVTQGDHTEPAWKNVYVVRPVEEIGIDPSAWSIEDFQERTRSAQQVSKARFEVDHTDRLLGDHALHVTIDPYMGFRAALTYPRSRDAAWSLNGKTRLSFWLKAINADVTGWQGGPFVVLHGDGGQTCYLEPKSGRDLMRELDHNEAREGWRLFEVPLAGDDRWQRDGELPSTVRAISLGFDSWGAPPLQIWLDGIAWE